MTKIALGDILPPIPPPALFPFSLLKAPAPIPKEISTSGRIIVSPITCGSPTTVLDDNTWSIPLNKEFTVVSKFCLSIVCPPV